MASLLVYGSYGFVGGLIARELVDRGREPLLAGRDRASLAEQAEELDLAGRQFALDDPSVVTAGLEGVDCVLNCAGPFSNTAEPLVEGCLQTGTDYVDITGEIPVVERVRGYDDAARDAGATLLPAAGFSAVPMDCLAAHLDDRLPDAASLALGVDAIRVPSIGTLRTVIEGIDTGGAIRRGGRLEHVPAAWRTRRIDFGRGERPAVTMPMGEVSVAHYTTGVPNVEVYAIAPQPGRLALKAHRYLAPVLAAAPVRRALKRLAGLVREGPSERVRRRGQAYVWGEARRGDEQAVSRLRTPDPYVVTVDAAVAATERVLDGAAPDGFQTPAGAFGPGFVLDLNGVSGFFDEERPKRRSGPLPWH